MTYMPSVTVIIATYNASATLFAAMQSVMSQDYTKIHLLIVDGGSSDGTLDIIAKFDDDRISTISEPDRGIYDAWNKGVKLANSDKILFIGADDTLANERSISEFWRRVLPEHVTKPMLYGDLNSLAQDGSVVGRVGAAWSNPWTFSGKHVWSTFPIPIMATFFDRQALLDVGLFDPSLRIVADINLVLSIAWKSPPQYIKGVTITNMGFGGISTRPNAGAIVMKEAAQVRRRHGLGVYTNLEFSMRQLQHRTKFAVTKYLGSTAEKFMIETIHNIKKFFVAIKIIKF